MVKLLFDDNGIIYGITECIKSSLNILDITQEQFDEIIKDTRKYLIKDNQLVLNEEYEEIKRKEEKERISKLSLTKREVFLALYKAKQITPEMIKAQITEPEALIEFEYANEYYRGNPLIDLIGEKLGYTSDDLDYLFENKEFPEKTLDDVIEATEEAGLYGDELTDLLNFTPKDIKNINKNLPDVSLVDTSDSAED